MPKKVEQINDYLFIETYESNKMEIFINEMRMNDSEICEMKQRSLINTGNISPEIA